MTDAGSEEVRATPEATGRVGGVRTVTGLAQGITGWLLLRLVPPAHWAAQHPQVFAALALITALVPALAVLEMGRMRLRTLLTYLLLAALAIAGLAVYDIWREPLEENVFRNSVRVWPSVTLTVCAVVGLFIVNQLLEHRERGFSLFARYAQYFEDSWVRAFQVVVSLIFAGLAWGLLNLGAVLFELIDIHWFKTALDHNWVRCPFLATAFAVGIHITDVRPGLLRGMRNVVLTLLSWLLPLVVALSFAFLLALCVVGLKPLWRTRHAADLLLTACAFTVFLLNAAYKDGDPATLPPAVLRFVGRAAGPVLLPLAALAVYGIFVRVGQYGWTPQRVWSLAIAVMALIYTSGYTYAATYRTAWMRPLEAVNVCASLAILALLILLLTPVADPARLSVDSQVARLTRGRVAAAAFDYQFLRFNSAAYGRDALRKLAGDANGEVRERAAHMQAATTLQYAGRPPDAAATEAAFSHATVYPAGRSLPPGFRETDWAAPSRPGIPQCLRNGRTCDIYVVPYGQPGEVAVIVHPTMVRKWYGGDDVASAQVFQRDGTGTWVKIGFFDNLNCTAALTGLRAGAIAALAPEHDDLLVAGVRLRFTAIVQPRDETCRSIAAPQPPQPGPAPEPRAPLQMGPAFGTR